MAAAIVTAFLTCCGGGDSSSSSTSDQSSSSQTSGGSTSTSTSSSGDTTSTGTTTSTGGAATSTGTTTTTPATDSSTATTAPTFVAGILPGFESGTPAVGTPLMIDFGVAANNPTGYDVQMYRAGVAIAGSSASNVTSYAYTPSNQDAGQVLSAVVVAHNSAGASEPAYIPGEAM